MLYSDTCVCIGRRLERYSDSDLDVEAIGVSIAYPLDRQMVPPLVGVQARDHARAMFDTIL